MRRQNGHNPRLTPLQGLPIRTLKFASRILSKPFAEAESLESYGNAGYFFLGFAIAICTLIVWELGWANGPIGVLEPYLRAFYDWIGKKIPLPPFSDSAIFLLPILLWACAYSLKTVRLWLGETFANVLLMLVDWSLEAGEWCLQHRWASLLLIIVLAMSTTAGSYHQLELSKQQHLLVRDFENWLHQAEEFVEHSAMTHSEAARYHTVSAGWRESFAHVPDEAGKPAVCLKAMLDRLYTTNTADTAKTEEEEWNTHLDDIQDELENILTSCGDSRMASGHAARAFSLMNITMGRVYVRRFDKKSDEARRSDKKSDELQLLTNASARFQEAEFLEPKIPSDQINGYLSARRNGQGTVYVGFAGAELTPDWKERSKECQHDRYQCIKQAQRAFDEAADYGRKQNQAENINQNSNKDGECIFEDKRRANNQLDLLVRIGFNYDEFTRESHDLLQKWNSPGALAQDLEEGAQHLMECNRRKGPFVLTTLVTTAQALAVAAKLRGGEGATTAEINGVRGDIRSAGLYLLWAYSFEPQNATDWHLNYFCVGLQKPLVEEFSAPMAMIPQSLRSTSDKLMISIRTECQN